MTADSDLESGWVSLVPAAAQIGQSVRGVLGLVHEGQLPASIHREDGRRRLVFRSSDLADYDSSTT